MQAKITAMEKELQDIAAEKNMALQKSEERNQQLLKELEQYKVYIINIYVYIT